MCWARFPPCGSRLPALAAIRPRARARAVALPKRDCRCAYLWLARSFLGVRRLGSVAAEGSYARTTPLSAGGVSWMIRFAALR